MQLTKPMRNVLRESHEWRKAVISSTDLAYIFHEKLNEFEDYPQGSIAIAIIPTVASRGWTVVTSRTGIGKRPPWPKRIETIEEQLQKLYALERD